MVSQTWTCDVCGEPITSVDDGWVEWIHYELPDGRRAIRDMRIVHHVPASPRNHERREGCQFSSREEYAKDGGHLADNKLGAFVGPDGLMGLLDLASRYEFGASDLFEMVKRLHVPGYEDVREVAAEAADEGVIEPVTDPLILYQWEIDAIKKWLGG